MKRGVAESELGDTGTLHVEPDVVLVGHPDTGKDLYAFVRREHIGIRTARLGQRDQPRRLLVTGIDCARRRHDRRTCQFDLHIDLGRTMLKRLEGPDLDTKLVASLQILQCETEGFGHSAEHLSTEYDRRSIDDLLE